MVNVAALTIILVVAFIPRLAADQGGGHVHHHHSSPHEHEHEHEEDHGHRHPHSHREQHGDSHDHSRPHAHHEKHSSGEEHHHDEHGHGRQKDFRLAEELHERQFDEHHGITGSHYHAEQEDHHDHAHTLSTRGLWFRAMGSSLLVSLVSLICLLLLPFIALHGKPSKTVVDALAGFGAGSMLGDALLHQLPHAFTGSGGHSHDHGSHDHTHELGHERKGGHAHSLEDLSVGLAVLAGILLFFLVEKIVRQAEQLAVRGGHSLGHSHQHHRLKKDDGGFSQDDKDGKDGTVLHDGENLSESRRSIRKRSTAAGEEGAVTISEKLVGRLDAGDGRDANSAQKVVDQEGGSRLVLGYLNLFSDGVHNFTDGMALGSAFLLHGTVGGWSRTLFLLAHELPQEVGDFGILLRSGFGVFEALAFNFLSALVALAGTAVALLLGGNPQHSTWIEGFTAGGFIYIAVGAVMPDMHSQGSSFRTTICQLAALSSGMGIAIVISLAE